MVQRTGTSRYAQRQIERRGARPCSLAFGFDAAMRRALLCGTMIVASIGICFAGETNLWDEVLNVVLAHIKREGPTWEAAQCISMAHEYAWTRRTEIVQLVTPVLSDPIPDKVAGAIEVLYRVPYDAKEQALICLAWHRDLADMKTLLPFMLDSGAARSLPYHFRSSYGKAAIPALLKAMKEAEGESVREKAALQLVHSGVGEGFDYLRDAVLNNPKSLDRIRQWALDYLYLPPGQSTKGQVARQIESQKRQRATGQKN
jgi:hypothetical protein